MRQSRVIGELLPLHVTLLRLLLDQLVSMLLHLAALKRFHLRLPIASGAAVSHCDFAIINSDLPELVGLLVAEGEVASFGWCGWLWCGDRLTGSGYLCGLAWGGDGFGGFAGCFIDAGLRSWGSGGRLLRSVPGSGR